MSKETTKARILNEITNALENDSITPVIVGGILDELLELDTRPYRSAVGIMTQIGTNAPTFNAFENNLGGPLNWSWEMDGIVSVILPQDHNDRAIFSTSKKGGYGIQGLYNISASLSNPAKITINMRNGAGNMANLDGSVWIEIRVYN
jgi:hypothetical protein